MFDFGCLMLLTGIVSEKLPLFYETTTEDNGEVGAGAGADGRTTTSSQIVEVALTQ